MNSTVKGILKSSRFMNEPEKEVKEEDLYI